MHLIVLAANQLSSQKTSFRETADADANESY